MKNKTYAVIGGGINGLAVARQLKLNFLDASITIFEKENDLARHQSSHNSGVVHAGLYYEPNSLKAHLCRRGATLIKEYCLEHDIPYDECGKMVVALHAEEEGRLDAIYQKSLANRVPGVRMLSASEILDIEPNCQGRKALYSPSTAIVSYESITKHIAKTLEQNGCTLVLGQQVTSLVEDNKKIIVKLKEGEYPTQFDHVITCAGLQSDRLAQKSGDIATPKIIPFFGQYYIIDERYKNEIKGLIYPVPDPKYPFLGVHFTKRIDGQMMIGPNAFISFGRENYKGRDVKLGDVYDFLSYKGFWQFSLRNMPAAMRELKTVMSQKNFLAQAAQYVPSLSNVAIEPAVRGIRAQAMNADGSLVDDFVIRQQGNITHIRNAPSPGATSSFAIAEYIVNKIILHRI